MVQTRSGRSSSGMSKQVSHQQATHQLRQQVIAAINKLSDRDTYAIASEELESVARSLNSDDFGSFLSCLYDTDSRQKSTVRKECVKLFATLADAHGDSLSSHLPRMVGNVIRRLKDPDSNVRDACVDAIGVMASRIAGSNSSISAFLKPFLDALGEQNRYLQVGSALCLSRAIDNAADPQLSGVLQRLLPRILKLLGNPNFLGKAALLSVVGSIVEAGGASTQQVLSCLIPPAQEALQSNDWATRKAASDAFCRMTSNIEPLLLSPFKSSCIASLESCRFDKVKPVRDSVILTLQAWRSVPDSDGYLPSPKSSAKENMYVGHLSAGLKPSHASKPDSVSVTKNNIAVSRSPPDTSTVSSIEKRTPLIDRKTNPSFPKKGRKKVNDWHIEVTTPRSQPKQVVCNEDFDKSYITNAATNGRDRKGSNSNLGEYREPETVEKIETPRPSDVETKCIMVDQTSAVMHAVKFAPNEKQQTNSTSTDGSTNQRNGHDANDLALIRKQLFQIENQQSSLLELIQRFIGSSQEGMRCLESRVHGLERTVDEMAQDLAVSTGRLSTSSIEGGRGTCCKFPGTDFLSSKFWRKSEGRFPAVRIGTSDVSSLSKFGQATDNTENRKHKGINGGGFIVNPLADIRGASRRESIESTADSSPKPISENLKGDQIMTEGLDRNRFGEGPSARSVWKASKDEATLSAIRVAGKDGKIEELESVKGNSRPNTLDTSTENLSSSRSRHGSTVFWSVWTRAVDFLRIGDVDSAFVEVLCPGSDLLLIRLMNRTGPVLEQLSQGTIVEMLQIIMQFLMKQKYLDSIIPWIQQVVDLTASNGPDYLDLPPEAKKNTLSALQEAPSLCFMDASSRNTITQFASKLSTIWAADLLKSR